MRITFSLPRRQAIELTLQGPAPSCRPVGTLKINGVRGVNRLDFVGRIGRRSIRPGVYILTLTRGSTRRPVGQPLLVQVVSPRRTIFLGDASARRAVCDGSAGVVSRNRLAAFTPGFAFLPPQQAQQARQAPARVTPTAEPAGRTAAPPRPERGNVLGASVDLPSLPSLDEGEPWAFAAVVLLIGLPLLLISVLVVRFLRGSWNP